MSWLKGDAWPMCGIEIVVLVSFSYVSFNLRLKEMCRLGPFQVHLAVSKVPSGSEFITCFIHRCQHDQLLCWAREVGIPQVKSLNHRAHDRSTITCNPFFFVPLCSISFSPVVVLSMAWWCSSNSSSVLVPVRVRVRGPCGRQKEKNRGKRAALRMLWTMRSQLSHLPDPNGSPLLAPQWTSPQDTRQYGTIRASRLPSS